MCADAFFYSWSVGDNDGVINSLVNKKVARPITLQLFYCYNHKIHNIVWPQLFTFTKIMMTDPQIINELIRSRRSTFPDQFVAGKKVDDVIIKEILTSVEGFAYHCIVHEKDCQ